MYYGHMPLYPPLGPGGRDDCVRVPVFEDECCAMPRLPPGRQTRRVVLENPCRPGERAEVLLGLDEAGNLMLCVRRDPRWDDCGRPCRRREPERRPCCGRPKPPPRRDCHGYRLYED